MVMIIKEYSLTTFNMSGVTYMMNTLYHLIVTIIL